MKQNHFTLHKYRILDNIHSILWLLYGSALLVVVLTVYVLARPIILEEYCMPKAQEAAKQYSQLLIEPPQDLIIAYKQRPYVISKDSQPTPYYVELLRCELRLSKRLYPFLHLND